MSPAPTATLSPKQAARALGVSESSLKRWCDQGLLPSVRTPGGHRKVEVADLLRFSRERGQPLVAQDVLGLPASSDHAERSIDKGADRFCEALLAGQEVVARQIIFDLLQAKHPLSRVADDVIAGAFRRLGDCWACNTADVFQERRGCVIVHRLLAEIRRLQTVSPASPVAIGGTLLGDQYTIPTALVELVLRESGFDAQSLGISLPTVSLVTAIETLRPRLFWLSVSEPFQAAELVGAFDELAGACAANGAAFVVGGRGLTDSVRAQLTFTTFCDTLQHLERFVRVLAPAPPLPRRANVQG